MSLMLVSVAAAPNMTTYVRTIVNERSSTNLNAPSQSSDKCITQFNTIATRRRHPQVVARIAARTTRLKHIPAIATVEGCSFKVDGHFMRVVPYGWQSHLKVRSHEYRPSA